MKESRTKSSIKNITYSLLAQFVTIILNYVCRFIFVKTLSKEYLGVNGLFSNILTIFSLAELGIGSAIVYSMYKPIAENNIEKVKGYMSFYKKCYNVIALIVLIIGLILLPNLSFFLNEDTNIKNLNIIYLLYLIDSVFSYLFVYKMSILNAMQKNYICNFYQVIGKILMSVFMCVSLLIFKNFLIYLIIQILFKLITNLMISYKADKMFPYLKDKDVVELSKEESKNIFKNVYALFCNQIGNVLINGTDNIIISKYVNLVAVGLYSNYSLVTTTLSNLIGQIFNSIVASVGNLATENNINKSYKLFKNIHFVNYLISSFCLMALFCCIDTFIELSFGKDYLLDYYTLIVILINFYLLTMKNVIGTFKYGLGIFWDDKYCTIIRAVINIVTSIILVNNLGIMGVFLGTLISDVLTTFWYQPYILYKKGFNISSLEYFKDFVKYSIILFVELLVLYPLKNLAISNLFVLLIVEAISVVLVFIVVNFVLFRKNEGFEFIKNTIKKIFKKIKR